MTMEIDLDNDLKALIKQLGLHVAFDMDLEKPAHYVPDFDLIVINSKVLGDDQRTALLHEIGHAAKHKNMGILYRASPANHIKIEAQANEYVAKKLVYEYLDSGCDKAQFNTVDFIAERNLDCCLEDKIKGWVRGYQVV